MREITIMAVEDDPDDLDLFKEALLEVRQRVHLIVASNGRDALDQLSKLKHKPDIIFMDYNMPLMDGKHCLENLKNSPDLRHIPVVMHSTAFAEGDVEFYEGLDVKVLLKQTVFSKLVTELASILNEVRSRISVE